MNKCIFLDRDGVLNKDKVDYVYKEADHVILPGVVEALHLFKNDGFKLVIITNQSGIAKGIYTSEDVMLCYKLLQDACGGIIDGIYYAPYHPEHDSQNLTSKPASVMFEKAIAKFGIDVAQSWMVGDKERDLVPAKKLGIKTIHLQVDEKIYEADMVVKSLLEAAEQIVMG